MLENLFYLMLITWIFAGLEEINIYFIVCLIVTDAPKEVRQQMNMITAWMDSSQVYSSTMKSSQELRVYHRGNSI